VLRPIDLLQLVADEGDVREGVPAAVRAAVRGDYAPILRAKALAAAAAAAGVPDAKSQSLGMAAARTCEDADLPWARTAPAADRDRQARLRVSALGADAFGAFGPEAALESPALDLCKQWPAGGRSAPGAMGVLPPVPSLLISADQDLVAPRADARRLAALIPGSRLLTITGSGHDVLLGEGHNQECAAAAVQAFLQPATVKSCPRPPFSASSVNIAFPHALGDIRPASGVRGRPGRTLAAVHRTLADITFTTFLRVVDAIFGGGTVRAGGLRGGRVSIRVQPDRFVLHRLVFVPGVSVSGTLFGYVLNHNLHGRLKIAGRAAAAGTLAVRGTRVTGRLGGQRIDVRMDLGQDSLDGADETP
jgi:hypothetical protein